MSLVSAVIPAHPARVGNGMLTRAVQSVLDQTRPVAQISIAVDQTQSGSAITRNSALYNTHTEWVAFLDSDDIWYPGHLETLLAHSDEADLVYPWFDHPGWDDPYPGRFGAVFAGPLLRRQNYIPTTVLARAELVKQVGGFLSRPRPGDIGPCDEYGLWLRMLDAGGRFVHVPERTWVWHAHGGNTSGSPRLGDART